MSLLSVKNTFAAIDLIKRKLSKAIFVLSIVIDIVFVGYYLFLVFQNLERPLYIVLYSILVSISLVLLVAQILYRRKEEDDKTIVKQKKAKKKRVSVISKILTYLVKTAIIVVAVVEIVKGNATPLTIVLTILSGLLLLVLFVMDITIFFISKGIEMIKLAINEDLEASNALKVAHPLKSLGKKLLHIADEQEGIPQYEENEQEVLDAIHAQAEENEKQEKAQVHDNIEEGISRIWNNHKKKVAAEKEAKRKKKAEEEKPVVSEIKTVDHYEDIGFIDNNKKR